MHRVLGVVSVALALLSGCASIKETVRHDEKVLAERREVRKQAGRFVYSGEARVEGHHLALALARAPVCTTHVHQRVARTKVTVRTGKKNYLWWIVSAVGGGAGLSALGGWLLASAGGWSDEAEVDSETGEKKTSARTAGYAGGAVAAVLGVPLLVAGVVDIFRLRDSREQAGVTERRFTEPARCKPGPAVRTAVKVRFTSGETFALRTDASGRARLELGRLVAAAWRHSRPWAKWSVAGDASAKPHAIRITAAEHAALFRPRIALAATFDDSDHNGDGALNPGERAALAVVLRNSGQGSARRLKLRARLDPPVPGITLSAPPASIPLVRGRRSRGLRLSLAAAAQVKPGRLKVIVSGRMGAEALPPAEVVVPVRPWPPRLKVHAAFDDSDGNGDLLLNPGERAAIAVTVTNQGLVAARGIRVLARLAKASPGITLGAAQTLSLKPRETASLRFTVAGAAGLAAGQHRVLVKVVERQALPPAPVAVALVARPSKAQSAPARELAPAEGESIWVGVASQLKAPLVRIVLVPGSPRLLFGVDQNGRLVRSRDGGRRWRLLRKGLGAATVTAVAVDPASPTTLVVGTRQRGVWRSQDGGNSFQAFNTGFSVGGATPAVLQLAALAGHRYLAATDKGLFLRGARWQRVAQLARPTSWISCHRRRWLVALRGAVALSADAGASWKTYTVPGASGGLRWVVTDPFRRQRVVAIAGTNTLLISRDGGKTWRRVTLLPALRGAEARRVVLHALAFGRKRGVIYLGTSLGILRSRDGGASWRRFNYGVSAGQPLAVRAFGWRGTRLWAATTLASKGLFRLGTVRRKVVFGSVLFATGSNRLGRSAAKVLRLVAAQLLSRPGLVARVEGHTDSTGDDAMNQRLSERRAAAVRAYLIRRGVPAARLQAVGFGEKRPVASNDVPAGRLRNRRVEVYLIGR